jgi:fluoroacetyl-CoA thioesterase
VMIAEGTSGSASFDVDDAATAVALGSGDLEVLGTPKVVALVEEAAVAALGGDIDATETSVGIRVIVDHLAAVRVGDRVEASARVTEVDGRRVRFEVAVTRGDTVVATGEHVRVIVDRRRFLERLG